MITREQAVKLYSELNRKTQEGEIQWQKAMSKVTGFSGHSLIDAFVAQHNAWRLGLLRVSERYYDGENDVHGFDEDVRLVLLNIMDHVQYEFPGAPGLTDLLDTVAYKTSNAAEFVADILGGTTKKK